MGKISKKTQKNSSNTSTTSSSSSGSNDTNSTNHAPKTKLKRTRKSVPRDSPPQRSSVYRGVTRYTVEFLVKVCSVGGNLIFNGVGTHNANGRRSNVVGFRHYILFVPVNFSKTYLQSARKPSKSIRIEYRVKMDKYRELTATHLISILTNTNA